MTAKKPARATDKERLNWLTKNGICLIRCDFEWRFDSFHPSDFKLTRHVKGSKSPRQAIDAAMAAERRKK